jgi:hypothetical protein
VPITPAEAAIEVFTPVVDDMTVCAARWYPVASPWNRVMRVSTTAIFCSCQGFHSLVFFFNLQKLQRGHFQQAGALVVA